jgi:hypothetical protein
MKKIILLTLWSLFACMIHAQIVTDELPYGLKGTAGTSANGQNVITLPAPDRAVIAREDSINDSQPEKHLSEKLSFNNKTCCIA